MASERSGVAKTFRCVTLAVKFMDAKPVTNRDDLIGRITELLGDHRANGDKWENNDLPSFLEAMAAWLNDCDGYYRNTGQTVDVDSPNWQVFADALRAATIYE